MKRNTLILFFCFLIISAKSFSQVDPYPGIWHMEYVPAAGMKPVVVELKIASSEKNILYPAHLILSCDNFSADYALLLVRKSSRELGISKNKFPVSETPFTIGNLTNYINGVFDYSKDFKGIPVLTNLKIQTGDFALPKTDSAKINGPYKVTAERLVSFLKNAEIKLSKISDSIPANDTTSESILSPSISPAYFGLHDTIFLKRRDGVINLTGVKKKENDIVTVSVNSLIAVDLLELTKKTHTEDILLDTGMNILTFFADNFGTGIPNKGKLNLAFGPKKINLDFNNSADSGASFITVKLYVEPDKDKDIYFRNNISYGPGNGALQRNDKLVGSIVATTQQLTLAIWDDAVEDGDSISINIDGRWIVQGFPVKKNPQFITVTLKPGPNTITFIADNLGSIPPNTSILEIIDGKKRKSYSIETTLGENNLIKIFYDVKPGQ